MKRLIVELRKFKEKEDFTTQELHDYFVWAGLNVSVSAVTRWLRTDIYSRFPGWFNLAIISEILGISMNELCEEYNETQEKESQSPQAEASGK